MQNLITTEVLPMRDFNETTFDDLSPELISTLSEHINYTEGRNTSNNR